MRRLRALRECSPSHQESERIEPKLDGRVASRDHFKPEIGRLTPFPVALSHGVFASRQVEASVRLFSERHYNPVSVI
jgi:hypothetical protein